MLFIAGRVTGKDGNIGMRCPRSENLGIMVTIPSEVGFSRFFRVQVLFLDGVVRVRIGVSRTP